MRQRWIDIAKGIGIILMVVGHADAPALLKNWIYGFHMPLFFIIAGYTFNRVKWLENGFAKLMKSRAKAYLFPYIFLFLINLISWQILFWLNGGGIQLIDWCLAGIYSHDTLMPNCAPLWFLTCLFVSYVLFWILIKQDNIVKRAFLAMVQLIVLLIICGLEKKYGITQLPWHIDVALVSSIFMLVGYELKDKTFLKKNNIWIILGCFSIGTILIFINGRINMVQNQYQNIVLFILAAVALSNVVFFLSSVISNSKQKIVYILARGLEFCGQNTLIFIGFNYLFNVIVRQVFKVLGIQSQFIYCLVDSIAVVTGCVIVSLIWNKYKKW